MGVFRQFPYSNFHEMNMDEIIKIVKNLVEEWATYHAEWDAWMEEINDDWSEYQRVMDEAWENMKSFINNYFDNLDVQNEINNKIISMVQSGEFDAIVSPYIPPEVTNWLAEHITQPVGVVIDDSLSVSGACADAKTTGDWLRDISLESVNIWTGDYYDYEQVGGVGYVAVELPESLPFGTYTLSGIITSNDTDSTSSLIAVYDSTTLTASHRIVDSTVVRDSRFSLTFTASDKHPLVFLFAAGGNISNSAGDTIIINEIQLEIGSTATDFIAWRITSNDKCALRASDILIKVENMATTYSDMNDVPANTIIGVLTSAAVGGLLNYPMSVGGEVVTIGHHIPDAVIQTVTPFNRTSNTKIYIRTKVNEVWGNWQEIETDINYMGYDLQPTGDNTDRGAEILAILSAKGVCRLAPGDFYITTIVLPSDSEIIGACNQTRLIALPSAYDYMIRLRQLCKLTNLTLLGATSDITVTDDWNLYGSPAGKCAIRIEGTGSTDQHFKVRVRNVSIGRFAGSAIFVAKTGYSPTGGCHFSDIFVRNCNAGIAFGAYAEFHRIENCNFNECYYGVINNGGNNVFENCDFSINTQGLLMDNSSNNYPNSSHGSFVGCTFNHSDNNNGVAIELNAMVAGEMFVGCNIFYGAINIIGCQGIVFNACNIGNSTPITINNGGGVQFANCVFRTGESTITDNRPNKTHFDNCYYLSGSAVVGTP